MTKLITVTDLKQLLHTHGLDTFLNDLRERLRKDYSRWQQFTIMPRPAMHVPDGVIELMPICDDTYYSFKYVNGHPKNPQCDKLTVMATGQLSTAADGEPMLISEMTYLTALRTAATSALATELMARHDATRLAIIGTGAQSEFQLHALMGVRDITTVYYYDLQPKVMDKFERNCSSLPVELVRCTSTKEAVRHADIVTVCTAAKRHADVVKNQWVKEGTHINGLGGDCPGKTELEKSLVERSRIAVEYFDQAHIEGEIQRWSRKEAYGLIHAELHELTTGHKTGRINGKEITLFDSVGISLEDYSALRLVDELAEQYDIGQDIAIVPELQDVSDLWSSLA